MKKVKTKFAYVQAQRKFDFTLFRMAHCQRANSNFSGTDFDFGVDMAEQYNKIQDLASHYGVGSKLKHVIGDTFKPYLDNLMDAIEQRIEKNREGKWIYGVRYESLDREKVYEGFHKYF